MTSGPESEDQASEIIERLANPVPALLLLRYVDARLPNRLAARLRSRPDSPRCHVLPYRAHTKEREPGSASDLVAQCRQLASPGSCRSPALLLVPEYPENGAPPAPDVATQFWIHLNAQREALGHLDARILVCLDPAQEPYAATHARDLLSWCAPKFALFDRAPQDEDAAPELCRDALEKSLRDEPRADLRIQARSLAPLWEDLMAAGRPLSADEVGDLGLPLLEAALQEGRLADAERLDRAIATLPLPRSPARGSWLRLRGDLARAQGRFSEAARAYEEALQVHEALLHESPKSPRAKRDLAVTLSQFAAFLMDRG